MTPLPGPTTECAPTETWPCCWDGCEVSATHVVTFRGQGGHVHDCTQHTAVLREWADVETAVLLPCHLPHGPSTWVDDPKPLL